MSKYSFLLWDIDGTVLDFLAAEREALKSLFTEFGLGTCTDEMVERYSAINLGYWKALERGEITKSRLLVERFRDFFRKEGIPDDRVEEFNEAYQVALGDTIVFYDDSLELLKSFQGRYIQAAITNGTKLAQSKKLTRSGLVDVFDGIFISEDVGYEKPNREFFDYVFTQMGIRDTGQVLVIGDSLTSDIRGGNYAGVDTCWYNPFHKERDVKVDITYEISSLQELTRLLQEEAPPSAHR